MGNTDCELKKNTGLKALNKGRSTKKTTKTEILAFLNIKFRNLSKKENIADIMERNKMNIIIIA